VTAQGPFFIIGFPRQVLFRSQNILQHIFGFGQENLSPPEGHESEKEEDGPGDAHEDDHDGVPDDEPGQVKNVCQHPNDGDETHVWKPTFEIANCFGVSLA